VRWKTKCSVLPDQVLCWVPFSDLKSGVYEIVVDEIRRLSMIS
jgi:hypothetical protein